MPQRTNDYQEIIEAIERYYAPEGAEIEPSAMVKPLGFNGPEREVDVLITIIKKNLPYRIAVEAKDHSRALDQTAIEQYIGKYYGIGGVNVHKVVIVAKSYTTPAINRARLNGFEVKTVTEVLSGEMGFFQYSKESTGKGYRVSNKNTKSIEFHLLDKKHHRIDSNIANQGIISYNKIKIGTAASIGNGILRAYLSEYADRLYESHPGKIINLIAEYKFSGHAIRFGKSKRINLKSLILTFPETCAFPDFEKKEMLVNQEGIPDKNFVQEKGGVTGNSVKLGYEKIGDDNPGRLHLQIEDKNIYEHRVDLNTIVDLAN